LRTATYDGVVITIGALASVPMQVAVLAFAAHLRSWKPQDYFALNVPKRGEVIFAAFCVIALTMAFDALMYVSGRDVVPPFQADAYQSAKDAGWLIGLLLAIVVVAPVGEEIVFRGFLYRGLLRPGHEVLAIIAISLAWALLHIQYDWLGMAQIFTAGLVLGWFRWASGSTSVTIVMHVLINAEAMLETAIKVELLS
jgi:membrane protease YdiL (CAAX protease family)